MTDNIIFELSNLRIFLVPLLQTAVATAIIEMVFWYIAGFRSIKFELLVFIINIVSNLSLNIAFLYIQKTDLNIVLAEILVVLSEFVCIKMFFGKYSAKRLIKLTIFANLTSYLLGVIYFSILK